MKTTLYIAILCLLPLTSCNRVVSTLYGVNKTKDFSTRADYTEYITKATSTGAGNILYIHPDDHNQFFSDIAEKKIDFYYGTFINDSTLVVMSDSFEQNRSCGGRILTELQQATTKDSFVTNNVLKNIRLFRLSDNTPFVFPASSKRVAFLVYSYRMGRVHKKDYKTVTDYVTSKSDSIELFVLSLDPYYTYK